MNAAKNPQFEYPLSAHYWTASQAFNIRNHRSNINIYTQDALILAKKEDFDVFNALDLMENKTFLENLKFGIGDGNLQV